MDSVTGVMMHNSLSECTESSIEKQSKLTYGAFVNDDNNFKQNHYFDEKNIKILQKFNVSISLSVALFGVCKAFHGSNEVNALIQWMTQCAVNYFLELSDGLVTYVDVIFLSFASRSHYVQFGFSRVLIW